MRLNLFAAEAEDGGWPQMPVYSVDKLPVPRYGEHIAFPGDDHAGAVVVAVDWYFGDQPFANVLAYHDPSFTPAPMTLTITDQDVRELLSALEDAADYRQDQGDSCQDCDTAARAAAAPGAEPGAPGKCGDHATDDSIASMYLMLHERLQAKLVEPREIHHG